MYRASALDIAELDLHLNINGCKLASARLRLLDELVHILLSVIRGTVPINDVS